VITTDRPFPGSAFDCWHLAALALTLAPFLTSLLFVLFYARRCRATPPPPSARPESAPLPPGEEERDKPRRTYNPAPVLISDADGTREPAQGWVIDRNFRGLGLLLDGPVAVGTVLGVRACAAPEGTPWWPAEVKYCRPEEGRWAVGCKFLTCPPPAIALLFG